ncbi:MAG: putative rane protein [Nocardia sp.]|uniref:DoxX family protein n=1 Tax=Nocardia sp. TaxID=1821 RepID=UPI002616E69A|nr:DoxX family protein [Nocardia sp.]MCU1639784.1 putative rane protein [Nocardia sp.]
MNTAYHIVGVVTALWVGFSAYSIFTDQAFVVEPLVEYGVPRSWWTWLGTAKAAGAVGLLVGFFVPAIGIAAAIGVILYFAGAVITTIRAHSYKTTVYPVMYMAPAIATLVLQVAR